MSYYCDDVTGKRVLLVVSSCRELWMLDQQLTGTELEKTAAIISRSHDAGAPEDWKQVEFWSGWAAVFFLQSNNSSSEQVARCLIRYCRREVFRVRIPQGMGGSWIEYFLSGGTVVSFIELQKTAPVLSHPAPGDADSVEQVGDFAAKPVNINCAFVNGYLYYPFTVERRQVEKSERRGGDTISRVVTSYVTKVVRSDGAVLDVTKLAAPRGTPRERQVLALTDGTRIEKEPQTSHYATWRLESIQAFIRALQGNRPAPHRPLKELLSSRQKVL